MNLTWLCDEVNGKPPLHRGAFPMADGGGEMPVECSAMVLYGLGGQHERFLPCECECHKS